MKRYGWIIRHPVAVQNHNILKRFTQQSSVNSRQTIVDAFLLYIDDNIINGIVKFTHLEPHITSSVSHKLTIVNIIRIGMISSLAISSYIIF